MEGGLESTTFKEWLFDNKRFYYGDLFALSREFQYEKDTEDYFYLSSTHEFLEKKEFRPLLDFAK